MDTICAPVREDSLRLAGELLRSGEVVAFPTETVYGLGAWAMSPKGIARVYEAKGRPSDNPLIVHVAPGMSLEGLVSSIPDQAKVLMDAFWPGPLTLIFPKGEQILPQVTGGLPTVAVRMPSHPAAMALIRETQLPIVAPSANTSGRPSPTTAQHVLEDLSGKIPLILDGGACSVGLESTILDLTEEIPMILRPGAITLEMLREVLGEVRVDPAVARAVSLEAGVKPKAPGMKYRHYAPKGKLIITDYPAEEIASWIRQDLLAGDNKLGLIGSEEWIKEVREALGQEAVLASDLQLESQELAEALSNISLGSRRDFGEIARRLFDSLRRADELGIRRMYGEAFSREALGEAIMNRFLKAASERRLTGR